MFKIGEFSKLVRVSPRMLRHYEKCGLLYPAETDNMTGYRMYSAKQIPLLENIVMLRDMGFSIDEIGDILPHFKDAAYMDKILFEKMKSVQAAITTEQEKLTRLEIKRERIRKENVAMSYKVVLKNLPSVKVLSLREVIPDYRVEGMLWERLGAYMETNGIVATEDCAGYSIYWDDDYKEENVDVEVAVPVKNSGKSEGSFLFRELEDIPQAATVQFGGSYENYGAAMAELAAWLEANEYKIAGIVRGMAIRYPGNEPNVDNYLTELQMAVEKIK